MGLKIYNTMSGKKEEFKPVNKGEAGMYVCGVTVYDLCHIGHARAAVVFDMIFRYLKYLGYKVNYVRNFTDIDDKIIKRANERGVSSKEIAEQYIKEFYTDMSALNIEPPTEEPKATEHIKEMIDMIQTLVDKGLAYESKGDVLFSVRKFKGYGKLSGKRMDELIAGARVKVGENKKDPLDFVLWKASKPDEPMWESPWGTGRPGWHIECSVMGKKYLGNTFDIHGGGRDLIFPHHENEIAQSESANGCEPVHYWVHNGFVNINKEKMSKSLGNFFTIRDILKEYDAEVIRFFLLSSHYRSPIDFSDQNLKEANVNIYRFYDLFLFGENIGISCEKTNSVLIEKMNNSMSDDFNSAAVIGCMNTEMRKLNILRSSVPEMDVSERADFLQKLESIKRFGNAMGFFNRNPSEYFQNKNAVYLSEKKISEAEIEKLIAERLRAKKEKQWDAADRIRDELASKGITLQDKGDNTEWRLR